MKEWMFKDKDEDVIYDLIALSNDDDYMREWSSNMGVLG